MSFLQVALPLVIGWALGKLLHSLYRASVERNTPKDGEKYATFQDVFDLWLIRVLMATASRIAERGIERHPEMKAELEKRQQEAASDE